MTQEEKIEAFEQELLPEIKDACVKLVNYFEAKNLPSSYTSCLGMYVENFITFNAKSWKKHCENYGVKMDFSEVQKELETVSSLDEYVEEFR
jgi:hypothetical protein